MTPSHTNKDGARYRYYVSHAILQKRSEEAGTVKRVSAPEIEAIVIKALNNHLPPQSSEIPELRTDRELIEQAVERIVLKSDAIEVRVVNGIEDTVDEDDQSKSAQKSVERGGVISVPWQPTAMTEAKGILHSSSPRPTMTADERDALLLAIGKARAWVEDLAAERVESFAEIAKQEGKVERHIRLLAPLAFVSPMMIDNIVDGVAPAITVTDLAKHVPYSWGAFEARTMTSRTGRGNI